MQYYKLDPCHYFTSPGLNWYALLKMTNIKLELMTDIDMFQFIEKGMCGGVAHEKVKVSNDMLSAYCKKIAKRYNISTGLVRKLIQTLRDKKNMCCTIVTFSCT